MSQAEQYQLVHVQFAGGSEAIPNATVSLAKSDGETVTDAAPGVSAIQAAYNAIERITGISPMVVGWNATSRDVVRLVLREDGMQSIGVARDEDIAIASTKAFVDAINHLLAQRALQPTPQEVPSRT